MKNEETNEKKKKRRPYAAPRILSREKIEGRANVCDPIAGGKNSPMTCAVSKS